MGDMFELGIVDPVKVSRVALENAVSVAALMLTTESVVGIVSACGRIPATRTNTFGQMRKSPLPVQVQSSSRRILRTGSARRTSGESSEPISKHAPNAAVSPPISPLDNPCRFPATTITINTPGKMKLAGPKRSAQVLRNGCAQRKRKPSAIWERIAERSGSRFSWKGVRILSSETVWCACRDSEPIQGSVQDRRFRKN